MPVNVTPAAVLSLSFFADFAWASSSNLRGSLDNASQPEHQLPSMNDTATNESFRNEADAEAASLRLHAGASCCSKCSGNDFCSPYSWNCYNGRKWHHYWETCKNSQAPAPPPPSPSSDSCCNKCSGHDWCSPFSRNCYDGTKYRDYWASCAGAPPAPAPPVPQAPAPPIPTEAPPLVPPPTSQKDIVKKGVMTLYHTTSPEIAKLIIAGNFKPGKSGWCGGATYFVDYPGLAKSKISPEYTNLGAVIEAKVDMGNMCLSTRPDGCDDASEEAHGKCCPVPDGGEGIVGATKVGCNSIRFDPSDGNEYIVWHPDQVLSKKLWCEGVEECRSKCVAAGYSYVDCGY